MRTVVWATWPVGLLLVIAYAEGLIPAGVFLAIDAAYVMAVVMAARRIGAPAAWFVVPGALIFSVAAWTGIPTARRPGLLLANAAVLALAAVVLLAAVVIVASRLWDGPGREPAALAIVVLVVGSAGYAANLLARFGVVLSGAAPAQAAVEDTAWQAHAYLRVLDGPPDAFTTLLVWLDLLQFAYVLAAYLAVGLLAVALGRAGQLARPMAWTVAGSGGAFSLAAILLAVAAPVSAAAAGVAFALTIPFMSTLLATVLAGGLAGGVRPRAAVRRRFGFTRGPAPAGTTAQGH